MIAKSLLILALLFTLATPATVLINTDIYDFVQDEWTVVHAHWTVAITNQAANMCAINWTWKDGNHNGVILCSRLKIPD